RNMVYPIAARRLVEGPDPLVAPEQLARHTVLLHREMIDTFVAWRHAAGLTAIEPAAIDYFDSGALMLEAAAQGLGVAFMHESHFHDANDSRLPVRLFRDWLIRTLRED
ncbi:hypothetical protein LTR94_025924, partial [Friedmanniomyces endolithicus]